MQEHLYLYVVGWKLTTGNNLITSDENGIKKNVNKKRCFNYTYTSIHTHINHATILICCLLK